MLFEIKFLTVSPLGFARLYFWREKNKSHGDSTSGGFNPFSVSLTFGNSIGAVSGKKLEESQGTARDATITS